MTTISFSNQELQALLQLMDIAVKAGGLQVAPAALVFQQKITDALQNSKTDSEPVKETK